MSRFDAGSPRVSAGVAGAAVLIVAYALTLAPDVTFWDAGEFIAAAHSLGVPHPPGTPLFILAIHVWAKLLFFLPYAVATNLFSAAATACSAAIMARIVQRATGSWHMAVAAAVTAGGMSSVWLNATETEVYAASLTLGTLMIWSAEAAGRERGERWTCLTAYFMALAVPLHLSALVAAPAAIVLASRTEGGIHWRRGLALCGVFVIAMGAGRTSLWMTAGGVAIVLAAIAVPPRNESTPARIGFPVAAVLVSTLAVSALAFLYVRAQHDPAINQGNPATFDALVRLVARKQYAVSPMWPREAPIWIQLANLGQYADWQIALSTGPTVMPSVLRSIATAMFLGLGYHGAVAHFRADRRTWSGMLVLLLSGALGVVAYLNMRAGPSIGFGILPANAIREARERDYFFVFAFWAWGIWAGIGAIKVVREWGRPAWAGLLVAMIPLVMNWRAVTRRGEPERQLPRLVAEAMLEATPREGVLFVAGDNDSYPLWYAQQALGLRRDVAIITIPLLPTRWYRAEIARRHGLLTQQEVEKFEPRLGSALAVAEGARRKGRPVAASITLLPVERARLGQRWLAGGMAYIEGQNGIDSSVAKRWAAWVEQRIPERQTRPAIDPVGSYFRNALDCPRQFADASRTADSTRLDSVCNYR